MRLHSNMSPTSFEHFFSLQTYIFSHGAKALLQKKISSSHFSSRLVNLSGPLPGLLKHIMNSPFVGSLYNTQIVGLMLLCNNIYILLAFV